MNSAPIRKWPARVDAAPWVMGLVLGPAPLLAANPASVPTGGSFDFFLISVSTLAVAGLAWMMHLRARRRLEEHTAHRIREMTSLIEHADGLLWEAEVELKPAGWSWELRLHPSVFARKLFNDRMAKPGADLWDQFHIDTRAEMDRRAREAMESNQPGYTQEFRAEREGRSMWIHENVSIQRLAANRFALVGLVTDVTPQHEAEAARRQSELTVDRILAHAQCLLWRATVIHEDGKLKWPHFDIPQSQFSELLFGDRVFSPDRGFWETLTIPEHPEMDARSTQAILGGKESYAQQFRAINQAGRLFWLLERVSITRVSDTVWSLVGVVTDITAQHDAEEARLKSEARLSHVLERADTLIWQGQVKRSPNGSLVWEMFIPRSQLYRRIFGQDPGAPAGFAWKERGVPEYDEMLDRCTEAISRGAPSYGQVFHAPGPEQSIWLSEKVTIVATGPDSWDLVGIVTDITARHLAEEAWRASQERLSKLLELANCLVWEATVTLNEDDTLHWETYTQRSVLFRRIFGEECNDPGLSWHKLVVPELPEMCVCTLRAVKACAPGYTQEFHVEKPDEIIWLREVVTMMQLTATTFRLVGVITDITAKRVAEEAGAISRFRLEQLLEKADCMVWECRVERRGLDDFQWKIFTPRSQLFRRIFGHDPDDDHGIHWNRGDVPEYPEMKDRARQAMLSGATAYEQDFHMVKPEGDIWLNEKVTIKPLTDDQWELVGIVTDITVQRAAEEARKASEARLRELLTRADCLLWEATVALRDADWSWRFNVQPSLLCQKLYGIPAPAPEMGLWKGFEIPEREAMNVRCRTAMAEGRSGYEQVFQIIRPDKSVLWISESVTIRMFRDGEYSLVGVAVDITPVRGAEEALAAEKERLAVTLQAMSESVITTDVDGLVLFMNPAASVLTGWGAEEVQRRSVTEICVLQDRSDQPTDLPIAQVTKKDVLVDLPVQTRLVTRSGGRRQIEGCCAPLHARDGKVIGAVLVFRDVTEQERLEQELVRATRLESVGVLAGGIAHDFNNILTAVMGNLALAQLDIVPESPAGSSLRSAEKAALRARDLTQQLLTFAKGGEPVRAAVQLVTVVREMAEFALHGSQVRASYDMAPDLWPADADKGQIGRVVQNLVLNAVQAMPKGGTLRIMARNDTLDGQSQPGLQAGHYIQIAITDTGEGIKSENLARIFDPYFTTKQTGTGLGLAAVYSIVKKHRGHIEVESQVGQGTTFRLWLPALQQSLPPADTRTPWTEPEQTMKGRVLFMDDEQIIRDMASILIKRFGFTVDCAADGAEAVAKYRAALATGPRYDMVIMDLTVPGGMGGLAALGELRQIDPQVKAIVSSGYSSDPVLANFRAHGFVAVIAKPYEVKELSNVLHEVFSGK
jgi:PAS domain S-box-containing protein